MSFLAAHDVTAGVLRRGLHQASALLERGFLAVHPATIRPRTLRVRHTYYLGPIAACVWLIMVVTGVLMMFHVRPAVPDIYRDIKDLQFTIAYGALVRNMHVWGASVIVVVVILHMLRAFFHRAYAPPRRATWFIGIGLFGLVFLSAHTGYLLPWDQRAYWGIVIAATMASQVPLVGEQVRYALLGGTTIGGNAVLHLYVLHCVVIPAATAALVAAHLWNVRKTGVAGPAQPALLALSERQRVEGSERQRVEGSGHARLDASEHLRVEASERSASKGPDAAEGRGDRTPPAAAPDDAHIQAFPDLLVREVIVLQWVVIVLMLLALTGDPPLEELANPLITPDPVKPPWYFVGLQELLHYTPPIAAGLIAPALLIALLVAAPFAPHVHEAGASAWRTPRTVRLFTALALSATALLAIASAWVVLAPTLAVELLALWSARSGDRTRGIRAWLARRGPLEWSMIWLVAVGTVTTVVGAFFRGPGGLLTWPIGLSP